MCEYLYIHNKIIVHTHIVFKENVKFESINRESIILQP